MAPVLRNEVPFPSYTALGRFGALQMVSFFLTGACVVGFVHGLATQLRGRTGVAGRVLLTLSGAAMMTSTFPTDHVPVVQSSWHGAIHAISFFAVVVTSVFGLLFTGLSLRRQHGLAPVGHPHRLARPVAGAVLHRPRRPAAR